VFLHLAVGYAAAHVRVDGAKCLSVVFGGRYVVDPFVIINIFIS